MFDTEGFYRGLGAAEPLGADEHLLIHDELRVMCTDNTVTIVFEELSTGGDNLATLFDLSRSDTGLLPFTTRSGHMALRLTSEIAADETARALQCINTVTQRFKLRETSQA